MDHLDLTNPDHAYFFGFFQTDGHLHRGRGRKGTASIELSARDEAVLHSFSALFGSMATRVTARTRATNFADKYEAVTWTAHDMAFREQLARLGVPVGRKSSSVAPPTVAFDRRGYLRGLIDGDGSVGFTARGYPFVAFTTASPALSEFFCGELRETTGTIRSIGRNARDGVFNPMVMMEPAAALAAWLYPPDCLALERKRRAAVQVASWRRPAGMRARSTPRRWSPAEDAIALSFPIAVAAERLGRSPQSVNVRRWRLRHAAPPSTEPVTGD